MKKKKQYRYNKSKNDISMQPQKRERKPFNWKRALFILGTLMVAYAIFESFLKNNMRIIWVVYEILAGVPLIVYVIMVKGNLGKTPSPEELTDSLTYEEKMQLINEDILLKKKARPCIFVSMPFLLTLLIACVTDIYIPMFFK